MPVFLFLFNSCNNFPLLAVKSLFLLQTQLHWFSCFPLSDLPESEWCPKAWGMAEMREGEEEAEDTHPFVIWPYDTSDYMIKVNHMPCSMLPGLWVMKNIWCMREIRIFPQKLIPQKRWSQTIKLYNDFEICNDCVYNDSHLGAVSRFYFEHKVPCGGDTLTRKDSSIGSGLWWKSPDRTG